MRTRLLAIALLLLAPTLRAQTQTYATMTSSGIKDAGGNLLKSGELCFLPVSQATGLPMNYTVIGDGPRSRGAICSPIANGVVTPFQLTNTQITWPINACYRETVTDITGAPIIGSASATAKTGLQCVQMNSNWCQVISGVYTCNLDNYAPNLSPQITVQAPTLSAGTFTTGAPGSSVVCTVSIAGAAPNYALSCTVPQGAKGETGATGSTGPQGPAGTPAVGSIAGLSGDGAGNVAVQKQLSAGNVAVGTSISAPIVTQTTLVPSTLIQYGDSFTACQAGITNTANCYGNKYAQFLGVTTHTVYAYGGDQACDTGGRFFFANDAPTIMIPQPLRTILLSTNDTIYTVNGTLPLSGYLPVFGACHEGLLYAAGIPSQYKVAGSAATMTGSCVADTTYTANTGAVCTSPGSSLAFPLVTKGGPIVIWPRMIYGDTGTWTYSIDGGTPVSAVTAMAYKTYNMLQGNNPAQSVGFIRSPVAAGTHSIVFTQTSATGTMAINAVGTPPSGLPYIALPPVEVGDTANIPAYYASTSYPAIIGAYRAAIAANIAQAQADGLAVIAAPVSTTFVGQVSPTAPADTYSDGVHPNDAGQANEIFAAFLAPMKFGTVGQATTTVLGNISICTACTRGVNHTVELGEQVIDAWNGGTITFPAWTAQQQGQTVTVNNIDATATETLTIYGSSYAYIRSMPPKSSITYRLGATATSWEVLGFWSIAQAMGQTQVPSGAVNVTEASRFWYFAGGGTVTLPSTWAPNVDLSVFNYDTANTGTVACAGTCPYNTLTSLPPKSGATYHYLSSGGGWVPVSSYGTSAASTTLVDGTVATTQTTGDTTNKVATDSFVANAITAVNSAPRMAYGGCSGVATSSATIVPWGLGGYSAMTCTNTASANSREGLVMSQSGVLSNLSVRCGTTGVNASSGVFIIYDTPSGSVFGGGGTNTGITVTYGTTAAETAIYDNTHTYAYAKGDYVLVKFTTQASETLGSCTMSFNY
jgi:hypothetical protein